LGKKRKGERQPMPSQPTSKLLLTLPTVRLLKDAMRVFEESLAQNGDHLSNVPFAREVIARVKTKLDEMLQLEDWKRETPFDYNEVHLLYAAVHLYLADLKLAQTDELLLPCLVLCWQFSLMVEAAHVRR